jgi:RNA polymerase sigma factor (sigma-70 family)
MEEAQGVEEAEEDDLGTDESGGALPAPRKLALARHLAEVASETESLSVQSPAELRSVLLEVVAGSRRVLQETLVRLSVAAHDAGDRTLLSLTFAALTTAATPLLASQAWDLDGENIEDQVQNILLELFVEIREGKAEMAGRVFSAWAKRRSVSLYRKRSARFEGSSDRVEPTAEGDPLDGIAEQIPSQEARVLLDRGIGKLPEKQAAAFIRVHILGMTQEEVAKEMNVNVRTLHDWLKKASKALGHNGDDE